METQVVVVVQRIQLILPPLKVRNVGRILPYRLHPRSYNSLTSHSLSIFDIFANSKSLYAAEMI